ncbi:MAG: Alpha-1,3-galactosidase B [Verrucomicrobiae bacterium]|nr:Alpha-1,3-galactosidase B [Verrucomicrobiae bacterium]
MNIGSLCKLLAGIVMILHLPIAAPSKAGEISLSPHPANSSPDLRSALENLRQRGGGTLQLQSGRYPCRGTPVDMFGYQTTAAVLVSNLEHVTIDGGGATLTALEGGLFIFRDCRQLRLRNFTIDAEPLPYTAGRVVELLPSEHAFDIQPVVPARPVPGRPVRAILAYDPERHRLAENGWELYQARGERDKDLAFTTPAGLFRIFQARSTPLPEKGWHIVGRHQIYEHNALVFLGCRDVVLEDITVRSAAGMAVVGWDIRDASVRRLRVIPPEGGWMSTTADALHFRNCRGTILIEDCEFAQMGDDAINVHGMYGLVTDRIDAHTLVVAQVRLNPTWDQQRPPWDPPLPDDILEYGTGAEPLLPQGQLRVAEARRDQALRQTVIRFTDALPKAVVAGTVLANATASPALRIRRCRVRGNRARGMLIQTRDVLVEDCIFEDISGAGIHICTDGKDWWESLGVRNVVMRKCLFRRCNFGVARRAAALDIFAELPDGRQSAAGVHRGIQILDNTFDANTGAAIHVGSADQVEIRGNRFVNSGKPVVRVFNSRDIVLRENTGLDNNKGISIEGNSPPSTIRIE